MKIQYLAAALAAATPAFAETLLNPVFQDHAVLQRGTPIAVWGTAAPGTSVTVSLPGHSITAQAAADGKWQAQLPAMPAGGPYTLTATSGAMTQAIADVLIGDVYLCSGQSNMALSVKETIDAGAEIQISANNAIRLMTVANQTSTAPLTVAPISQKWATASPATVPNFSGACYYFGREMQSSLGVPIGLIESAWGGANITSFMSTAALRKAGGNDARLDALAAYAAVPAEGIARWGTVVENYWRSRNDTPWTHTTPDWAVAPKDLGYWSDWNVPTLTHYAGHMWFRTSVTLSAEQAAEAAQISLGTLNEEDQTWINGHFLSASFGYGAPRNYALPAGALHAGANDIVVNVYCGWRGCGMFGPPENRFVKLKDRTSVPLGGPWQYRAEPAAASPRVPWGATAGLAMAYNAMIAPLAPYSLKGVLWYQGESNTGDAMGYRGLLKNFMADWRKEFAAPLPFLIVQLPDYGQPPIVPEESDWANLRESQRLVAAEDGNAGLAVTIEIGDRFGLHPSNKQEVGRRLAVAAHRLIYGDTRATTSPEPVSAVLARTSVRVRMQTFGEKLVAYNAADPIGFELCDAKSCRFAKAVIKGGTIELAVPKQFVPTRVRYCWAAGPVCTLYSASRMPAAPFEIAIKSTPAER